MSRPRAVLFLTGFGVVGRNHSYISATRRRGLAPLLITPEGFRSEVEGARQHTGHVVHEFEEIIYVRGRLDSPDSFTGEVVGAVERLEPAYEFAGVCAIGEVLVDQAGLIADRYGLRGPGLRAARVCRSKYLQRWYLPQFAPRHEVVTPGARTRMSFEALTYPVVVKPSSRHSSSGVVELASAEECREVVSMYPAHETLLVEERVSGPEFSVEALLQDGTVIFASATAKRTTESTSGGFTEIGHSIPYRGEYAKALIAATHELLTTLDFRDGMAHAEWRIRDSDSQPILMEVAARTPGDAILLLYRLTTGASMEEAVLQICLGEPATYPTATRLARQIYVEHPAGSVLRDVTYDGPEKPIWLEEQGGQWPEITSPEDDGAPAGLRAIFVLVARDSVLPSIASSDDRAVTFILDGADEDLLDAQEAAVVAALHLACEEAPVAP